MKYFSLSVLLGALTQQAYAKCETAYVYCPGNINQGLADEHPVSTCFSEDALLGNLSAHGPHQEPTNSISWGWNIDLKEAELHIPVSEGVYPTKICNVYAGAAKCDWQSKGAFVGTFSMTKDSVTWNLDGYAAQELHLHIGQCPYSDSGNHLDDGTGNCVLDEYSARVPGSYTLNSGTINPAVTSFSFDETNFGTYIKNDWENITLADGTVVPYDPFNYIVTDQGDAQEGYHYVSAHASVCPCSEVTCEAPEPAPTKAPTEPPTKAPTPPKPPTEPPTKAPTKAPTPPEPPATTAPAPAGANGDPHFSTWRGEHFEYHGKCDLELVSDPTFADGKGLDVHIRTEVVRRWSYIKHAAIRIGDDILQVEGGDVNENRYWFNKVHHGELKTIGGFPVKYNKDNEHQRSFLIDLGKGEQIRIKTYKEFVRVDFKDPKESFYGNTVGILGDFKTGKKLGRDGFTVIEDNNDFGQEWQVLPSGPKLFLEPEGPQLPDQTCILPSEMHAEEKRRRLGEAVVTETMAELACAKVSVEERDACVFDVLTTDDVEMAGAY
jgi:hypothetical protein